MCSGSQISKVNMLAPGPGPKDLTQVSTELDPWTGKCPIICGAPLFFSLSFHHRWIWHLVIAKTSSPMFNSNTPMCYKKLLPELLQLLDVRMWTSKGIYLLSHVISQSILKSFAQLKSEFALPTHMLFPYLQLWHTLHTQFSAPFPTLSIVDIMEFILYFLWYLSYPGCMSTWLFQVLLGKLYRSFGWWGVGWICWRCVKWYSLKPRIDSYNCISFKGLILFLCSWLNIPHPVVLCVLNV